jgi:hypothetical protein
MISFDDLNEELKAQQERLSKFQLKATKLHHEIVKDIEYVPNFDLFQRDNRGDVLRDTSEKILEEDAKLRDYLKGPTIRREKFYSPYWQNWNEEKNLLEDISRKESIRSLSKINRSSSPKLSPFQPGNTASTSYSIDNQGQNALSASPNTKSYFPSSSSSPLRTGAMLTTTIINQKQQKTKKTGKEYTLFKGDYIPRNRKAAVFASPTDLKNDPDNLSSFDKHLLGHHNSMEELVKQTMKPTHNQEIIQENKKPKSKQKSVHSSSHSYYDPNIIGNAYVKGGDMSSSRPRPSIEESLTKNCDIPNVSDTLKTVKGGSFGTDSRFPLPEKPVETASAVPSLPTINPLASSTTNTLGCTFLKEKRFPHDIHPMAETLRKEREAEELAEFGTTTRSKQREAEEKENGNLLATPGPGQYSVTRLFEPDVTNPLVKRKDFENIFERYKDDPPGYR